MKFQEGILILEDFSDRMKVEVDFMSGFSIELVRIFIFARDKFEFLNSQVKEIIQSVVSYQSVHFLEEIKVMSTEKININE